jgi:2-dehydropantoate 2-reductase
VRYVIYGAGAIGGSIGGLLHEAGRDVVLIARGPHLAALRRDGLRLRSPDDDRTLRVAAVGSPAEAEIEADDVVVLAMKTQDTEAALAELAAVAPPQAPIVCAQNGVENERLALRRFANVYAMLVVLPSEHLSPGVVEYAAAPVAGVLDLGRYGAGADGASGLRGAADADGAGADASSDPLAERVAADLTAAGFASRVTDNALGWKYSKLLLNLGNAIEAAVGPAAASTGDLLERARAEALACYDAAAIAIPAPEVERERRAEMSPPRGIDGRARAGGSSWQSLARGAGTVEADWLNGEIVLLGRLHGVPTPVNAALQRVANQLARDRGTPGSLTVAAVEAAVGAATA